MHSVVFSYWTKTLDRTESELKQTSICYIRLDGQLAPSKRSAAVKEFQGNPEIRFFWSHSRAEALGTRLFFILRKRIANHRQGWI